MLAEPSVGSARLFKLFPPWDLLRGRDVFRDQSCLDREDAGSELAHFAPNCATFSKAREIPIRGVKQAPVPLRSELFPEGIPSELAGLSKKARRRLLLDTEMAVLSAERCLARHRRGKLFSLEHPGRSIALSLPAWKRLRSEPGIYSSFYHTCMFEGSRRRKFQILIHNVQSLTKMEVECHAGRLCARSGLAHEKWRPVVHAGRVQQFTTGEEREYPAGFCSAYADLLPASLSGFLEVFSGPNAPLSNAVSLRFTGCGVERREVRTVRAEAQARTDPPAQHAWLPAAAGGPPPRPLDQPPAVPAHAVRGAGEVEVAYNRRLAVASGRQPSFGKRSQLIPDGLNDPLGHLRIALTLDHPFASVDLLRECHRDAFALEKDPAEAERFRAAQLARLRELKTDPQVRRRDAEIRQLCGRGALKLGPRMDLGLMEAVQRVVGLEDQAVPLL